MMQYGSFGLSDCFAYIILLSEKFLQFYWLGAEVFQLHLKYLHVKITVTMVTEITKKFRRTRYEKMAERFPDFEIQESQKLKQNSESQNTKKSTSTENTNFETKVARLRSETIRRKVPKVLRVTRISQVVV